jgi:nucleotide-binding universal stress UspA family protein
MYKRILVPLDGSSRAEEALPVAARIARASGGSLYLLEVVSPVLDYGGGFALAPMMTGGVIESEVAFARDYLKQVAASEALAGIQITTEVAFGLPAQYILATATSGEVDLIVLCSHGRTGFTRWALGSVAHTLAHESIVPTLVLRESKAVTLLREPEATRPLRALVPLDGSELAEAALTPAFALVEALAAPGQAALHLAQVVKLFESSADEGFVDELNEEAVERAKTYLARVMERSRATTQGHHLSLTSSVEPGRDVASALVSLAEGRSEGKQTGGGDGCDLIAISTHGRHGLQRWVMGSVTERVLTSTRLPLLIVRPQEHPAPAAAMPVQDEGIAG